MASRKPSFPGAPLLLTGGGVLLLAGFAWGALFAGVPYQDATPALSARFALHSAISSWAMAAGGLILLAGLTRGLTRFLCTRIGRRRGKPS